MKTKIDLIYLEKPEYEPRWELGKVFYIGSPSSRSIHEFISNNIGTTNSDGWLFWDSTLPEPLPGIAARLIKEDGDIWHAGLKLGIEGQPVFLDYVAPTWMLNRDPDKNISATSWRLSFRCCLIRTDVLKKMKGPIPEFTTYEAAGLEMGYRYIRNGVFIRYQADLVADQNHLTPVTIPVEDQLLFIKAGFGNRWANWAMFRSILSKNYGYGEIVTAWKKIRHLMLPSPAQIFVHSTKKGIGQEIESSVSVIIPTLDRYPYLRNVLNQLRSQTIKPIEIIIIDQTSKSKREQNIALEFIDLPIIWRVSDTVGQCSSRNLGLELAKGDFILFIDDDDEIPQDLIETHLSTINKYDANISSGVAQEDGAGPLPFDFSYVRISDVFPTNNSMIRKEILQKSGLFDLAYDRGQAEDADLGMRIYLGGEKMILNPEISVIHHHAPVGGLRAHKARVNTYAASRKSMFIRVLPSPSDIYLRKRYFSPKQVSESLWLAVVGNFSIHGAWWKKIAKVIISSLSLAFSLRTIQTNLRKVDEMITIFPQIPAFPQKKLKS
jgi:glycosyltransferase involved in cell wall biosynthesis